MRRWDKWDTLFIGDDGWALEMGRFSTNELESDVGGVNIFDLHNVFGWRCLNQDKFEVDGVCKIGSFTLIDALYGVELGENVEIGPHCTIISIAGDKKGKIIIKKGAKIGAYSMIMPGVTIEENAVIPPYSLIKKDAL